MQAIGIAAALVMLTACGLGSPAGQPGAPPSANTLLFGLLEARGDPNSAVFDTVAIVGLDGKVRAQATFTPMPVPVLGCLGPIPPSSAHVAAGRVFYADGKGVVRSLALDGTITNVTTFPLTSRQQMLSFAVSPDGTRLLGTVFTIPLNATACQGPASSSPYAFDAYAATSGGPSSVLYHQSWTKPQDVLALTGWDAVGPLGTYPTVWATQGGGIGSTLGVFVRVDRTTGRPGAPLADPTVCRVWDTVATGAFVCIEDSVVSDAGTDQQTFAVPVRVRGPDGGELWNFRVTAQIPPYDPTLAPDGQHVTICCSDLDQAASSEMLVGRDGSQVDLAIDFVPYGWIGSTTMVGSTGTNPNLAFVTVSSPGVVLSTGIAGAFVGTVRGARSP